MDEETWKWCHENYEVSDRGNVRRSEPGPGTKVGKVLRKQTFPNGYQSVYFSKSGKVTMRLVHILVAAAFIGPPPEGHEVNHIDGDKKNNHINNLEYLTRSDNLIHSIAIGKRPTKLSPDKVREMRSLYQSEVMGVMALSRKFGIARNNVRKILDRELWSWVD